MPADLDGIEDDEAVGRVEERLDHVNAADPDIHHQDSFGDGPIEQALRDGDPETVVTAEQVAHAGDQDAHRHTIEP
jgi:hypothetical protein